MSNIFVQFSDSTETTVVAYFAEPQDLTVYPNQGTIESTDPRYAKYYAALPTAVQAVLPPPTA